MYNYEKKIFNVFNKQSIQMKSLIFSLDALWQGDCLTVWSGQLPQGNALKLLITKNKNTYFKQILSDLTLTHPSGSRTHNGIWWTQSIS